jgi:TRAP-type C4-dicarboxylate transport system substrate-binding protein
VQIFDAPFLIDSRERAYHALDGALGQLLKDGFAADTGFRVLGFWDNGFRHMSNRSRPIRMPADCAGLTIRTMNSEVHQSVFRRLGFDPVFVDIKDFRDAVESGRVDAQENPLTNTFGFGFNRTHRYITLSGHFFGVTLLLCHGKSYDAWPAEMRTAVDQAAVEATRLQRHYAAAEDMTVLARVDPALNEIIELTSEERVAFVAAVQPILDGLRAELGSELFAPLE